MKNRAPLSDRGSRVVNVKIYDREYSLRTADPERLIELARELDARMRATAETSGTVDTLKAAIHAALGLADDLLRSRQELRTIDETLGRKSLECVTMLERFLH
jgi:cell division protein ZapA